MSSISIVVSQPTLAGRFNVSLVASAKTSIASSTREARENHLNRQVVRSRGEDVGPERLDNEQAGDRNRRIVEHEPRSDTRAQGEDA
jgi:hypothetical protein